MEAADDPHVADVLDQYLALLQTGQKPDRDALVRQHPDLASALKCLEVLESMASLPVDGEAAAEPDDGPATELPRDFGPYELLAELGRGGMGVVYRARQKDLDRTVAIKMILASHLASPEHVRRFQSEARAAARLRHPHIVHIHEVGNHHGQHYFSMDYIEGESLAQRLARGPMHVQTAVRLLSVVARAVEHLHQQGIVHRDLKPSNILLDDEGAPYVTDFGLAKLTAPGSEMTATGVIAGTPSYMAPEQASGRSAAVGPAADVYSLGAILYELLTGKPPFLEESPLDTLLDVLAREPTRPRRLNPRIPPRLELICLKCLGKTPAERYDSAAALADDLDRFARGEALQVRPPHLGRRLAAWTRRQPALTSRLAVLGVFYVVELFNYGSGAVTWKFHEQITVRMAAWAVLSAVCQQFLESRRWSIPARFVWGTLDSLLLLAILLVADGAASALVVGYPLLIVASALWFRVRFVWFITGLSLLSYGVLVMDYYRWRPELQGHFDPGINRHVVFAVALVVLGSLVAYLVQRVRTLSSFCGRPLP